MPIGNSRLPEAPPIRETPVQEPSSQDPSQIQGGPKAPEVKAPVPSPVPVSPNLHPTHVAFIQGMIQGAIASHEATVHDSLWKKIMDEFHKDKENVPH